tara:strand:- start:7333 stop:7482 length:150 start_codon:yes stop_codon:yes gene_type:complete
LVSAISSKGVIGWMLYENGGAHKSNLVKEAVKDTKNILLYSVLYRLKTT